MISQPEIQQVWEDIAKRSQDLQARIPVWISKEVPVEWTTATYGVMQKSAHYIEQIMKGILFLLASDAKAENSGLETRIHKATLGELVRLFKAQQKHSEFFQTLEKAAICKAYSLLDNIVVFRNKFVHSWPKSERKHKKAERDLIDFLEFVRSFCSCRLLSELLIYYKGSADPIVVIV